MSGFSRARDHFEPAYLTLHRTGELARRAERAISLLKDCRLCPRDCGVNRLEDGFAVCHVGRHAVVSSAFAHFGEEDCLRGTRGSGTIFFGWCNLRCVFCQNYDISWEGQGRTVTARELAALMIALQGQGCHNINFVTPEHVVPQILEALVLAVEDGLRLPLVYNTGAYDSLESLQLMDGVVDIYMPDFKMWTRENARRYLKAPDYPDAARAAIAEMHRQVGSLVFDEDGVALRGVLLRHLVMPGDVAGSRQILGWVASELGPDTYVNIMAQYRPAGRVAGDEYVEIQRRPRTEEYEAVVAHARSLGLSRLDTRTGLAAFRL